MSQKKGAGHGFTRIWKNVRSTIGLKMGDEVIAKDSFLYIFKDICDQTNISAESSNPEKWAYFLNQEKYKHQRKDIIFDSFLNELYAYIYNSDTGIIYENIDKLKERVKKAFRQEHKTPKLDKNSDAFIYAFEMNEANLSNINISADTVNTLKKKCLEDEIAALTWILVFSLFPKAEKWSEKLTPIQDELNGKPKTYEQLLRSIGKGNIEKIENDFYEYPECYPENLENFLLTKKSDYLNLLIAKTDKDFKSEKKNKSYYKTLEKNNAMIKRALDRIFPEPIIINDDDDAGSEKYDDLKKIISLKLQYCDNCWKMPNYDEMIKTLSEIEDLLYMNSSFTDKNLELLAITKRKQGIYYNHISLLKDAIKADMSAYFYYKPTNYLERSKVKNNEAYVYRKWCKYDKACRSFKEAYELRKKAAASDKLLALVQSNWAIALSITHNFDEAKDIINKAYETRKKLYNNGDTNKEKTKKDPSVLLELITTKTNKAFVYMLNAKYSIDNKYEYLKESIDCSKRIQSLLDDNNISIDSSNIQTHTNHYIQFSLANYYNGEVDIAINKIQKAIDIFNDSSLLDDISQHTIETALAYAYALLYYGKYNYLSIKKGSTRPILDIVEGYLIIDNLYNKYPSSRDYLNYPYMIACFHLAALNILYKKNNNKFVKTILDDNNNRIITLKEKYNNAFDNARSYCSSNENSLALIDEANKILTILTETNDNNIDTQSKDYITNAFEKESYYIKSFIEHKKEILDTSKTKDGINILELLENGFLDFFIIYFV